MRMNITGKNLVNGNWSDSSTPVASSSLHGIEFFYADQQQVDEASGIARQAYRTYATSSRKNRADFLDCIAQQIELLGDEIVHVAGQETHLPEARLVGERARTVGQLKMFADLIRSQDYLNNQYDSALPNREPLPRPDLRLTHKAIGPVVIFGASNFPLAFSVAGGDTASALAAGCPVIVKAHEAHSGTCEVVTRAIDTARKQCALSPGVFQMLQGEGKVIGQALVKHPDIGAVGFTGSLLAGRTLYDLCHRRDHPIPFYGELGSINPVFCLPQALHSRGENIAKQWVQSLVMGVGQFCTNPGVVIMLNNVDSDLFIETAKAELNKVSAEKMLTSQIYQSYQSGKAKLTQTIDTVLSSSTNEGLVTGALFQTTATQWISEKSIQEEVFGPAGIVVLCDDLAQMQQLAHHLQGQLTATLQIDKEDYPHAKTLMPILEEKAGRILANGFPTGVEVCSAMMHGGPYPASTDVRATSVGTLAICRWLRPVSYQNIPSELLPEDLS